MGEFDNLPERRTPGVLNKWTLYPRGVLPMWVADMDFPAPRPIRSELRRMMEHGVLGYEMPSRTLKERVAARMEALYGWKVGPDAVVAVPGVVGGFTAAARALCTRRRGVLVQPPVYNEFHEVKRSAGVPQLDVPMVEVGRGRRLEYEIDWDLFEHKAPRAGMFLLCNPHNPLGRIFRKAELTRMAEICLRHDVWIVSDEIHSELLLGGAGFTPLAAISRRVARRTITLIAPSKTFNIPGLLCAFAVIPDRGLRERYLQSVERLRLHVGSPGLHAARVAFSGRCDGWLGRLRRHLTSNRNALDEYVHRHLPAVRMTLPEATYLAWLDFSGTGIDSNPCDFFRERARVALSDGRIFGKGGDGCVRLNFGTSRALLMKGLERMRRALEQI